MARKNPIEERVDLLSDQWTEFAQNADARLLVWQAKADELALIEAFFAKECDSAATEIPDMFIRMQASFANPAAHGYALREELIAQYQAARPQIEADGLEAGWQAPFAAAGDDESMAWIRTLSSFHKHHANDIVLLAVWLDPLSITDVEAHLFWLQRVIHAAPAAIRFFVVDADGSCLRLVQAEPSKVMATPCNLDMSGALDALAAAQVDTEGGRLRLMLVQLGAFSASGDVACAKATAGLASALTVAQGWPHLGAVVQISLAAAYLQAGLPYDALRCYTEAERLGAEAEKEPAAGDDATEGSAPYATRIRLNARFGQGSVLVAEGAWAKAAQVYVHAFAFAETLKDERAQLDCLRLASVCYERAGEPEKAWAAGLRGLGTGAAMTEADRKVSTLAYLLAQLMGMTEAHGAYSAHRAPLEKQAATLLGPDWRDGLAGGA